MNGLFPCIWAFKWDPYLPYPTLPYPRGPDTEGREGKGREGKGRGPLASTFI